jgi:hypothetical protein
MKSGFYSRIKDVLGSKDEAPKHLPKPKQFTKKVMITVWWHQKGIVQYSFLEEGETINGDNYCSELVKVY